MPFDTFLRPLRVAALPAVLILGAAAPAAALTPDEAYELLQTLARSAGASGTTGGEITRDGDTLGVSNFTVTLPMPPLESEKTASLPASAMDITLGQITLLPGPDDSVLFQLAEETPLDVVIRSGKEDVDFMVGGMLEAGATLMQATGTADDATFTYGAPQLTYRPLRIEMDDLDDIRPGPDSQFTLNGVGGSFHITRDSKSVAFEQESTADASVLTLRLEGSDAPETMSVDATNTQLTSRADYLWPRDEAADTAPNTAPDTAPTAMNSAYGSATSTLAFDDGDGLSGTLTLGASAFMRSMDAAGRLESRASLGDLTLEADPGFGMMLSVAIEELVGDYAGPLAPAEAAQPFSGSFALRNITPSPALWAMIQGSSGLPASATPISVEMAAHGTVRIASDLREGDLLAEGTNPLELVQPETLTIDQLRISGWDAELSGDGAFATASEAWNIEKGLPEVTGKMNIVLEGYEALMAVARQMPSVPPAALNALPALLMLYAEPTTSGDGYRSTLRLAEDGAVTLNNLPLAP